MNNSSQCTFAFLFVAALMSFPGGALAQRPSPDVNDPVAKRLGFPEGTRSVMIHADDAGITHSTNAAIEQAFASGAISSCSIIVPSPWFPEIAAFARSHPEYDFGVHLALTAEWEYLRWGGVSPADKIPSLLDPQGFLWSSAESAASDARPEEVKAELRAQIERTRRFGVPITHLDTHMDSLMSTPQLTQIYIDLGREYHLPIVLWRPSPGSRTAEWLSPVIAAHPMKFVNPVSIERKFPGPRGPVDDFPEQYRKFVLNGKADEVTEIIVHLAIESDESRAAMGDGSFGASWRSADFRIFSGPEMRAFLKQQRVRLVTWRQLRDLVSAY
jgi:predicted glycoside hydrolase/deacetylase ChbG (UPF0249 family)